MYVEATTLAPSLSDERGSDFIVSATAFAPLHDELTALKSIITQHQHTGGKMLSYFFGKETNAQIALREMPGQSSGH